MLQSLLGYLAMDSQRRPLLVQVSAARPTIPAAPNTPAWNRAPLGLAAGEDGGAEGHAVSCRAGEVGGAV